jgi:hypothetical protein
MWTVNKDTFETTNTVALVPASPDIHSPIGAIRFTYTNSAQVLWYENDVSHDSAAMSRRSYNPSSGFAELKLTARNLTYDNISLFSATQTVTSTITVYVTPLTTTETISGASIYQASINSYGVRDGQELTSFLLKSNSLAQNMAQAVTKFKGQPLEKVELKMCNGTAMSAWGLNTVWSIQATSYGIPNWSNYIVTEINGTHSLNGSPNISGNIILTKVNT